MKKLMILGGSRYALPVIRAAHALAEHAGQEDVTIGSLRKHLKEKKHLLKVMAGVFRRKK